MIGVVLAGGASRRMGVDKARLPWPHRWPMAMTVAAALAPHVTDVVLVRRGPDDGLPWWHPADLQVQVLRDGEHSVAHPLTGLLTAWDHHEAPLLVAPCDVPFLDPAPLAGHTGSALAFDGSRLHPLVARLEPELRDEVARLVGEGRPARALGEQLPRVTLPPEQLRNINGPEDAALGRALSVPSGDPARVREGERARLAQRGCVAAPPVRSAERRSARHEG